MVWDQCPGQAAEGRGGGGLLAVRPGDLPHGALWLLRGRWWGLPHAPMKSRSIGDMRLERASGRPPDPGGDATTRGKGVAVTLRKALLAGPSVASSSKRGRLRLEAPMAAQGAFASMKQSEAMGPGSTHGYQGVCGGRWLNKQRPQKWPFRKRSPLANDAWDH